MHRISWHAWLVLLLAGCAAAPPAAAPAHADFTIGDVTGRVHRPFADPSCQAVVLIFTLPDCPIANAYAPEIKRTCADYEGRGVAFFLVNVDPDISAEDVGRHAADFGHGCPAVHDASHALVRKAGAELVPEAAVFTPDGERVYLGRIDDLFIDYGQRRPEPRVRDLRAALDAVLAGRPVPKAIAPAIGCFIPTLVQRGVQQ